jgi:hypothetical protein
MELQHSDRRGWVEEISAINRRLREDVEGGGNPAPWGAWPG